MIVSLVVVYPSPREGGSLILRHRGKEWTFDAATTLTTWPADSHSLAYIMFYGDVEHEISLVTSGYRVTLTYNLYQHESPTAPKPPLPLTSISSYQVFHEALKKLLQDPTFFPDGGSPGFGLSHQYSIASPGSSLEHLYPCLKGSDAMLVRVACALSLDVSLRVVYTEKDGSETVMSRRDRTEAHHLELDEKWEPALETTFDGKVLSIRDDNAAKVFWVTEYQNKNNSKEYAYTAYGNEPHLSFFYSDLVLHIHVGPFANRSERWGYEDYLYWDD